MKSGDLVRLKRFSHFHPGQVLIGLVFKVISDIDPSQNLYAIRWTGRYNGETSLVDENEIEVVE